MGNDDVGQWDLAVGGNRVMSAITCINKQTENLTKQFIKNIRRENAMNLFNTKNLIMLGLSTSLSLATGMLHAAELVQFSNGSIADANDVNHNFNELAARIQNQTGATGPQGEAGPLSSLNCKDGEVALANGGSWVCGSSGSTAAPVPVGERIRLTVGGVVDNNWQSWAGFNIRNTYTFVNNTDRGFSGIVTADASHFIEEVNVRGAFNFMDAGSLREVSPANFSVFSLKLSNWASGVIAANLGAVKIAKAVSGSSPSGIVQYVQVVAGVKLEPVVLKRKVDADLSVYNWYLDVASGTPNTDDLRVEVYEDASRANVYVAYNFTGCVPSDWKIVGDEEEVSLTCSSVSIDFANSSPVTDWVSGILTTGNDIYKSIIVDTATRRYDLASSNTPTAYVLPVLGVDLSGAITQQFSFQPNDFNVDQPDPSFLAPK